MYLMVIKVIKKGREKQFGADTSKVMVREQDIFIALSLGELNAINQRGINCSIVFILLFGTLILIPCVQCHARTLDL